MESLYFIAVVPPDEIEKEIRSIKQYISEEYHCKAALRSPAHITLQAPFKWDDTEELFLENQLKEFTFTKISFQITLNGFGAFIPRVIFINVEENVLLADIHRQLDEFCQQCQFVKRASKNELPFHPHVTVAFRDLKKEDFFPAFQEFKDKAFNASFISTHITLLKHTGKEWKASQHFYFTR